jgi:arylsulfatase A-like enzyme
VNAYNYARDTTPTLRSLAEAGIVFENAFAANTNTAPSHASMFTGLYPAEHGVVRNGGYELREDVRTLVEHLGPGWARAAFVSGFALRRNMTNLDRGFEHYDDDLGDDWTRDAEVTFARAERWLRARRDERPLVLFFHLYDPHHPYDAPEPFRSRFLPDGETFRFPLEGAIARFASGEATAAEFDEYIRRYDAEVAYADHYVGRLFETLEELGYWDEALVVVVSDHGETLDERPAFFDHGARVYEEQIRVPLLLRLPGNRRAGTRVAAPVHHVDLTPTILDLLGRDALPVASGRSLRPLFAGDAAAFARRPVFSTACAQWWQVPELGARLADDGWVFSIRTPRWKLISYPGLEGEILQLFEFASDPHERHNLAKVEPAQRDRLHRELEAWRRATDDGRPVPKPALAPSQESGLRALGYLR